MALWYITVHTRVRIRVTRTVCNSQLNHLLDLLYLASCLRRIDSILALWPYPPAVLVKDVRYGNEQGTNTCQYCESIRYSHIFVEWNTHRSHASRSKISNQCYWCQCRGRIRLIRINDVLVARDEDGQRSWHDFQRGFVIISKGLTIAEKNISGQWTPNYSQVRTWAMCVSDWHYGPLRKVILSHVLGISGLAVHPIQNNETGRANAPPSMLYHNRNSGGNRSPPCSLTFWRSLLAHL
jgi:hypothetical protein